MRAILLAAALALTPAVADAADAANVPTVTLGPGGADRQVDATQTFAVKGKTSATDVYVLVMQRQRLFNLSKGHSCASVTSDLEGKLDPSKLDRAPGSVTDFATLAADGAQLGPDALALRGRDVLVAGHWARPAGQTGEQEFSVLVAREAQFFVPGGEYCLIALERRTDRQVDDTLRKAVAASIQRAADECPDPRVCDGPKQALQDAVATLGQTPADTALRALVIDEMYRPHLPAYRREVLGSAGAVGDAETEWATRVLDGLFELPVLHAHPAAGVADVLVGAGRLRRSGADGRARYHSVGSGREVQGIRIDRAATGARKLLAVELALVPDADRRTSDYERLPVGNKLPASAVARIEEHLAVAAVEGSADMPLGAEDAHPGRFLAEMLAQAGKLQRASEGATYRYTTDDGRDVHALRGIRGAGSGALTGFVLTLAPDGDRETSDLARIDVDPSKLAVPGSSLTLEELLVFEGRREIRIDANGFAPVRSLQQGDSRFGGAFAEIWQGRGLGQGDTREALYTKLAAVHDARNGATKAAAAHDAARDAAKPPFDTQGLRQHLTPLTMLGHALGPAAAADTTAIEDLANAIDSFDADAQRWEAAWPQVAQSTDRIWVKGAGAVTLSGTDLDQKSYVEQYVTVKTGYAWLDLPEGALPMLRMGVDITFVANAVEDPMWSNGLRDLARLFAIELAIRAPGSTGAFGVGKRYEGIGVLPPLFGGVSAQLLPYLTLSGGASFFAARQTALTGEVPQPVWAPYVGFSVQVNVPGLIRNAATPKGT